MKRSFMTALVIVVSTLVTAGIVYAATTRNITATLGGVSGDTFDLDGTMMTDSLKVGAQGVGGVTFFNGTIINNTTTSGADNPVTFGDNVRIDGRVYRGAIAGTSDSMPFIVNDNLQVAGSLTIDSLASDNVITSDNIVDGTITADDLSFGTAVQGVEGTLTSSENTTKSGGDYDTLTSLSITTGDSSIFCSWNGYGDTINDSEIIRVQMLLDGVLQNKTIRYTRTSAGLTSAANMATQAIFSVDAGAHTVALQWNTENSANMYYNTLDCIEL
ncbi:MAG: hypothetical protein WC693_04480 [Patescibacteria group bacterium]